MNPLLEAIAQGWGWKFGEPAAIVATNHFGNAIIQNKDGHYFRIIPEEWQCELFAESFTQLEERRKGEDFVREWEMAALVERAQSALGPLAEGEVYCLVTPGCLGGKCAEENIRKISLRELFAYSGDMARQIDDLPDGASVTIKVTE
jgi:hypothetical protein